jgi:hypothetical protein
MTTAVLPHVRHPQVPPPNGCRRCGISARGHAQQWVPSHRWHLWAAPTRVQHRARMIARHAVKP